jgi:tetratricopeptide (TPR) repeat protein
MKPKIFKIMSTFVLLGFLQVSFAADSSPSMSAPSWLAQAKQEIKSGKYEQAIQVLQSANQRDSADWNNLIGYSFRLKNPPDLAASETYYLAALKIEPAHRGALEYYGELLLMKNDLEGAEKILARLDKACLFSCEELRDLKKSIADYKSKRVVK